MASELEEYYSLVNSSFVVLDDAELHGDDDDDGDGNRTIKIIPMDYPVMCLKWILLC